MKLTRSLPLMLCVLGFGECLIHTGGCNDATTGLPSDADGGIDGAPRDAEPREGSATSDANVEDDGASPLAGWYLWKDYDPACGYYLPSSREVLPAPLRWTSCAGLAGDAGLSGPPGMVCETLEAPWAPTPLQPVEIRSAHVDGGRVIMLVWVLQGGESGYRLVVDDLGTVHSGIFSTGPCKTSPSDEARFGNYIYRIYDGDDPAGDLAGGGIGGPIDTLVPHVYFPRGHKPGALSHLYAIGRSLLVENVHPDRIYDLATGNLVTEIVPTDDGPYFDYRFQGDDLFWTGATSSYSTIKVWDREQGVRSLIRFDRNSDRRVRRFRTDGQDMVWTENWGRNEQGIFEHGEVWTSKYTTDPAVVASTKRKVRELGLASSNESYAVGCGYAAITIYNAESPWGQQGFLLVRLADGASWTVLGASPESMTALLFRDPLAITCEHVYLGAFSDLKQRAVRVRIDSLGSPEL